MNTGVCTNKSARKTKNKTRSWRRTIGSRGRRIEPSRRLDPAFSSCLSALLVRRWSGLNLSVREGKKSSKGTSKERRAWWGWERQQQVKAGRVCVCLLGLLRCLIFVGKVKPQGIEYASRPCLWGPCLTHSGLNRAQILGFFFFSTPTSN